MSEYQGRNKSNKALIVILVVLCIITALLATAMFTYITITGDKQKQEALTIPPVLEITTCPQTVYDENPVVVIDGTMRDDNSVCVLKINGETVETAMDIGVTKTWSKSYELTPGETKVFNFRLENQNGAIVTETKSVYCEESRVEETPSPEPVIEPEETPEPQITTPLQSGCEFVKKRNGGLNIRQYAGTSYEVVDFINGDDYTSRMTFIGNYKVDTEGYTWYQIISPNGKYGYVRSDLVQRVN